MDPYSVSQLLTGNPIGYICFVLIGSTTLRAVLSLVLCYARHEEVLMWERKIHLVFSVGSLLLIFVPNFFMVPGFAFFGYVFRFLWAANSIASIAEHLAKARNLNAPALIAVLTRLFVMVVVVFLLIMQLINVSNATILYPLDVQVLDWFLFLIVSQIPITVRDMIEITPLAIITKNFLLLFQAVGRSLATAFVLAGNSLWPVIRPLAIIVKALLLFCHAVMQLLFFTYKAKKLRFIGANEAIGELLFALSFVKRFFLNQMKIFDATLAKHSPRLFLFFNLLIGFISQIGTEIFSIPSYNPANFNNNDHRPPADRPIRAQAFAAAAASNQTTHDSSVVKLTNQNAILLKQLFVSRGEGSFIHANLPTWMYKMVGPSDSFALNAVKEKLNTILTKADENSALLPGSSLACAHRFIKDYSLKMKKMNTAP